MTDLRKAAEMALTSLESIGMPNQDARESMQALRQALAEPEQEPVAWVYRGNFHPFDPSDWAKGETATPLYTAPPKREWKELDVNDVMGLIAEHITDPSPELMDELYGLIAGADMLLQEKNT